MKDKASSEIRCVNVKSHSFAVHVLISWGTDRKIFQPVYCARHPHLSDSPRWLMWHEKPPLCFSLFWYSNLKSPSLQVLFGQWNTECELIITGDSCCHFPPTDWLHPNSVLIDVCVFFFYHSKVFILSLALSGTQCAESLVDGIVFQALVQALK